MLWVALLPGKTDGTPQHDDLAGLAIWALQYTPRVALVEGAIVMEVAASLSLFGGRDALRERMAREAAELGAGPPAWSGTSLAAIALARAGVHDAGVDQPVAEALDPLPIAALPGIEPHEVTLRQIGCRSLGDLRRLPRGGVSRRFGAGLLHTLDRACGLRPETHAWVTAPETFSARLELMARVEMAPAMLFAARRLLLQMAGWLAARHAGITAFTLRWAHDSMRARDAAASGDLTVRTAEPMRDVEHLTRLLGENLARVRLAAPVAEIMLEALDVRPLAGQSASLIPDPVGEGEALALTLERIAARLGPDRVLRPTLLPDHRPGRMQRWQPALSRPGRRQPSLVKMPAPTFMLAEPLRLAMRGDRPMYQGPLLLLAGPHRIDGGWWHRETTDTGEVSRAVQRDYWVAVSEHCGVLWVYRERHPVDGAVWFLHGAFA